MLEDNLRKEQEQVRIVNRYVDRLRDSLEEFEKSEKGE